MMGKRFGLMVVLIPAVLLGSCSRAKREISPLFLQEIDYLKFSLVDSRLEGTEVFQVLGVGIDTRGGERALNLTLRDNLPKEAEIEIPKDRVLRGSSFYGQNFSIPVRLKESRSGKELTFAIKGAPAIDCSQEVAACGLDGCDLSCKGACSAQFFYQFSYDLNPNAWIEISYSLTPIVVELGSVTELTLKARVSKRNDQLEDLWYKIQLPQRMYNQKVRLLSFPDGVSVEEGGRYTAVFKRFEDEEDIIITFQLVNPQRTGEWRFQDLVQAGGTLPDSLLFAACKVDTDREIERDERTIVQFSGSAGVEIVTEREGL